MYLAVKSYYNMLREIKIQGRYAMLGTFSRFDTPYYYALDAVTLRV